MTTTPKTFIYPEYYTQEDWGLVTQSSTESVDLGLTSSPATEHEDFGLVVTTQQELQDYQDQRQFLYDLDNAVEKTTYDYNDKAIVPAQSPDDYGSIDDAVTEAIDYGSIADAQTETADYRYIYYQGDAYPYGTVEFSGSAEYIFITLAIHVGSGSAELSGTKVEKSTFSEIGSGTLSAITGAAEVTGVNPPDQTLLFELSGTKVEKKTYSYNERAIFTLDGIDDYGLVSEAIDETIEDYGLISNSIDELILDYGTLGSPFNETVYPYGSFEFSGSLVESFNPGLATGSGSAEFSGIKVEKNTFREIGSGTFSAITGAAEATGSNPPDSTLLFELSGTKVEKNTYSYNERSILPSQSPDEYGSIADAVTESIDYGSIADSELTAVEDYRYIYYGADAYPYGTIQISGSSRSEFITQFIHVATGSAELSGTKVEKSTFSEIGSGTFSAITGAADSTLVNPPDQTLLFELSGTKVEKKTYSYNERAIFVVDGIDDYGLIIDAIDETIEDYGLISDSIDEAIEDYGALSSPFTETTYPYGTLSFLSGSAEVFGPNPSENTVLFQVSGTKVEKSVFSEIGSGTLSAITGAAEATGSNPPDSTVLFQVSGTKVEKKTYFYNEKSIFVFEGYDDHGVITDVQDYDDYGLLTDQVAYEDYGTLGSPFNETTYPYGTIEISGSALTELSIQFIQVGSGVIEASGTKVEKNAFSQVVSGTAEFSGTTAENSTFREIGSGLFSAITGAAEAVGANPPDSTVLFQVSGTTDQSSTFSQVVSGTAEFSGTKVEKSIFSEIGSGVLEVSGTKVEKSVFSEIGSGTLSAITGAAEAVGANPPDSTVLFEISGTTDQSSTFSQVVSGTAEFSGTKVEKNTFREIGSGVLEVSGTTDQSSTFSQVVLGTAEFSGTKVEKNTFREIGSGTFSAINGAAEVTGINPPDSTVLFQVSGTKVEKNTFSEIGSGTFSAINGAAEVTGVNPPDQTLLFELSGTKVEKKTYSYNERAIFVLDGIDDYGLVSEAIDETIQDYGLISDSIDEAIEDYGALSSPFTETTYPYGTIQVSGSAATELKIEYIHQGSGTIQFSGTSFDKFEPSYIGSGTLSGITGSAEAVGANPPDSTVLFDVSGTKVEKKTYSYNERAILPSQTPDDYGSIADAVTESIDYGSITDSELTGGVEDYRYIYYGEDAYPYGTIEISGSAVTKPILLYVHRGSGSAEFSGSATESFTPATEIGSGSFSTIGGSAEATGSNPPDSTVLFEFSGTKVEKNSYSYNERSVFVFDGYDDHGVITDVQDYDDYGLLTDEVAYEDYGTLSAPFNETTYPYGTIEISGSNTQGIQVYVPVITGSGSAEFSGSAPQSFIPTTEIGSGSFSAFSGAAEATGSNPPDSTVLFEFSGTKVEKNTFREIGSGSAIFAGTATNIQNNFSKFGSGSAEFSGTKVEKSTFREIGSGSFSAIVGSVEVTGSNPPDQTLLFELSGTKVEKSTFREIGSGSAVFTGTANILINPGFSARGTVQFSGSAPQSFIPATEIGSGSLTAISGAAEVIGVNPPDSTLLFELSGTKVEKSTFREIGSGSATFTGEATARKNPGFAGRGTVEFSGSAAQSFTPATEIGSGLFSAIGGAAEVAGVNPPDSTVLFEISGTKVEKNTFREIGSGPVVISGDAELALEVLAIHRGEGVAIFSGSAAQSFTPATEIGSGSFSAIIGSAESTLVNPPDSTVLFEISGSYSDLKAAYAHQGTGTLSVTGTAVEKSLPSHEGSGTLSAITGAAESTLVNPPDSTVLFEISGTKVEKNTFREIGSGSFSAIVGSVESVGANPPENTVLFELSGTKVEKSTFREIGSGSVQVLGNSLNSPVYIHNGSGSAEFSGSAPQSFTPATEIGSGTFSAIGGSAEVVGANPPENTVLFELSGTKVEKSTFREISTGSIVFSGSMTQGVQVYVPVITGSGIVSISGTGVDKFRPNYRATGTITIVGNGRESYSPATEIGSGSIQIDGVGVGTYVIYRQPYVFVTII